MLKQINFDDKTYEQLVKEGLERLSATCGKNGSWTDYNAHDPGIMLLELFAWLTEMQRFHLNQITDNHKLKYLKLLGVSPKTATPMKLPIIFDKADDNGFALNGRLCIDGSLTVISKGTTTLVEGIPYTTTEDVYVRDFDVVFAQTADCLTLQFTSPLYKGEQLRLCVHIAEVGRVPMQEGYYTFARLQISNCECVDHTYGLMQSGIFEITPSQDCTELRINIVGGDFDTPPVIEWVSARYTELVQVDEYGETLGSGGMVKENTAFLFAKHELGGSNPLPSFGGHDAETVESTFASLRAEQKPYRAITSADYTALIKNTPGTIIESSNVYSPEGGKVCICVKPYNDIYAKNIRKWLFDKRLPCTEIELVKPIYWEGSFYVTVIPQDWARGKVSEIKEFITEYIYNFRNTFGYTVSLSKWRADFHKNCPYIKKAESLSLVRINGETALAGDDVALPPNGLLRVNNIEVNII